MRNEAMHLLSDGTPQSCTLFEEGRWACMEPQTQDMGYSGNSRTFCNSKSHGLKMEQLRLAP